MGNFSKCNACPTWKTATGSLIKIPFTSTLAAMMLNKTLQRLLTNLCRVYSSSRLEVKSLLWFPLNDLVILAVFSLIVARFSFSR